MSSEASQLETSSSSNLISPRDRWTSMPSRSGVADSRSVRDMTRRSAASTEARAVSAAAMPSSDRLRIPPRSRLKSLVMVRAVSFPARKVMVLVKSR